MTAHESEFDKVFESEKKDIEQRRLLLNQPHTGQVELAGLSLSGGGIRSAAFNLGVMQALHQGKHFDRFDYLSTVSGGGYIGASVSWFMHQAENIGNFPFARLGGKDSRDKLAWIRRHGSYLTPGDGLGTAALFAAALRGILINLFILVPVFVGLIWALKQPLVIPALAHGFDGIASRLGLISHLAALVCVCFLAWCLLWTYQDLRKRKSDRTFSRRGFHALIMVGIVFAAIQLVPVIHLERERFPVQAFWLAPAAAIIARVYAQYLYPRYSQGAFIATIELMAWFCVVLMVPFALEALAKLISQTKIDYTSMEAYPPFFYALLVFAVIYVLKLLVNFLFYSILSNTPARLTFTGARTYSVEHGVLFTFFGLFFLIGLLPAIDYWVIKIKTNLVYFQDLWGNLVTLMSVLGVLSTLVGWGKRSPEREQKGAVKYLLGIGLSLLIASAVMITYRYVGHIDSNESWLSWVPLAVLFALVIDADINYVSMHRFYRNRLCEAFLPSEGMLQRVSNYRTKGDLPFRKITIAKSGAPYHLVNTNLVTVGSRSEKLKLRGGDSFVFSPHYFGSSATGWVGSENHTFREMNLGIAMAISGAAVDPNTGSTRSWPLRIIMTWLNLRLGYWLPHPNQKKRWDSWVGRRLQSSWLWLIVKEMLGSPRAAWSYIRLSDGGHFENLGLYELIRRQCKVILVSDAGADPNYQFSDLARAIELARVDFNADIELDISKIDTLTKLDNSKGIKSRFSKSPFVVGDIIYDRVNQVRGKIIYIKSSLFKGLPEDVMGYARKHPDFPDQTTSDQFFSEQQFEAYREIGYRAAQFALQDSEIQEILA